MNSLKLEFPPSNSVKSIYTKKNLPQNIGPNNLSEFLRD